MGETAEEPRTGQATSCCGAHPGGPLPDDGLTIEERVRRARVENPGVRIDCYLLFGSHVDAFALHEAARAAGLATRISTTPRAARSSCGVALLAPCDQAQALNDLAARQGIELEGTVALPCQIDPRRDTYC